jgi:predicted small secreted protein
MRIRLPRPALLMLAALLLAGCATTPTPRGWDYAPPPPAR